MRTRSRRRITCSSRTAERWRSSARCRRAREVGITLNLDHVYAESATAEDEAAALWVDGFHNRWFLDPIFKGSYPQDMLEAWADIAPPIQDGDLETISHADRLPRRQQLHLAARRRPAPTADARRSSAARTSTAPTWVGRSSRAGSATCSCASRATTSRTAIYVTENGAAYGDVLGHDGNVDDPERQAYLEAYIAAAAEAVAEGAPLRGYFAWSLLDNFEWAWGYWKRFGLVYVDYPTLERVPKGSFYWYRDLIAAQRAQGRGSEAA